MYYLPIPVTGLSKARVWSRSLAVITGLNPGRSRAFVICSENSLPFNSECHNDSSLRSKNTILLQNLRMRINLFFHSIALTRKDAIYLSTGSRLDDTSIGFYSRRGQKII